MSESQIPNPGAEINVDSTEFSEGVKQAYAYTFLSKFSVGDRKVIQCTESLSTQLKRIVSILGYGTATLGSYVQSILEFHLDENKVVIAELRAASLNASIDPKSMDEISLNAKKYQALYLTGDYVNRTRKGIYVSRDLVDRIHKIIMDVNGEKPTVGSYVESIVKVHLDECADLIAEMTNDKYRKKA